MDSTKTTYATFPFEWTVKSISYQIQYRKAFNINEIDEIFCSIINAKENEIALSELAILLGFNLQDLAEKDILNIYLKGLTEYKLIEINQETIQLTAFGEEALQSKLKYKYYFATTELFENQTATGENFDFSFKSVFDIENRLSHEQKFVKSTLENSEWKQKLQFQLFGNDIYKGEIIELYESEPYISYKSISLQCEITAVENSLQLSIFKTDINKPDLQFIIDLPENAELKSELLRKGMYHHILTENPSITIQDIETYKDLWNWKELAENPKLDWSDKTIFELFRENGDGGIWSILSEKAPIESIKSVIQKYAEYWNWTTLTERFDDKFIKEQIENFDWDFEELSYKESELVQYLLIQRRNKYFLKWSNRIQNTQEENEIIKELTKNKGYDINSLTAEQQNELTEILTLIELKADSWDWNYLSKKLPDNFIETHIDDFPWDYYLITEVKSEILRNLFRKQGKGDYVNVLLSKPWNWKFISDKFDLNFLYSHLSTLAKRVDWHTVLNRFFSNEEMTAKCLNNELFKSLLKQHLPENFIVAHQKYLWTQDLIDFFENQNLIQWQTQKYINGFDTNENVEWSKPIFQKYHNRITTENGFLNVSKQISDYSLISDFLDFAWNWDGISQNRKLIENPVFIKDAFLGNFSFSNHLDWSAILDLITNLDFINKHLEQFQSVAESDKHRGFWIQLTKREELQFIFDNYHFPWDWAYITENSTEETILESFDDEELFEKWDWEIATRKIDKETILSKLEEFARFIDWKYLINEVFSIENELSMDGELPRIAACLSVVNNEVKIDIWKDLTTKIPFETLFPIVEATNNFNVFQWDWDFISNHNHFPTDIQTVNRFTEKINWTVFSENNAIQQKFNPNNWDSGKQWFNNIDRYLRQFQNSWNWQILSQNRNINHNRHLLQKYKTENWDWDYLTEFGGFLTEQKKDKNNKKYLTEVVQQFPKVKFEILSKRKDIKIDSDLILATKDKNWDWQVLSENEKAEISNELILELKDKNWNWKALSKRKNIQFSNETLLQLLDKDWDWHYLSENINLEFNAEFIEKTKAKSWNWKSVSRHKSFVPTIGILTLTKDCDIDWQYISKHSSLSPTKEILAKFENKWHWKSITENPQINFNDIDFLERFADKWNWHFICASGKLPLNSQILHKFKAYLDWNLISSNTNVHFTKEIIQEFKQFWNWSNLKVNKRVEELLGNYVLDEINKNATLNFLDKIEQQWSEWKGSIYHFSHIDNAVEIIKNRKIQSRNKAVKNSDSAGKGVIDLRHDAHDFARFYFRPHTPTQFYNEFLGKNITDGYNSNQYGWVSWYDKARGLGFPKCPIPIFFRFSIKEVLFKNEKKCRISNGNMQTSSTKFGSIEEMINKFGFDDLYYTPQKYATKEDYNRYRNYAQQEFLVKDELAFYDLTDFEIVCPSEEDRTLLISLLGNEHKDIFLKIVVDRSYYNNKNPRVRIEEEDSELHISTNFSGEGYFVLNGTTDIKEMEILVGDVSKTSKDKIIFKSNISLGNVKQNIQLYFVDESNRSWFVYKNYHILEDSEIKNKWRELDDIWKKEIYLNYQLSKLNTESYLHCICDESYGLDYLFYYYFIDCSDANIPNYLNVVDEVILNGLKSLTEADVKDIFSSLLVLNISGVNNLKPLSNFDNLEILIINGSTINDLKPLKQSCIKHIYQNPEYPNNEINFDQIKNEFPHIKVNELELSDIFTLFYNDFAKFFNTRWGIEEFDINGLLIHIERLSEVVYKALHSKVRHYVLAEHCYLVCKNFIQYKWNLPHSIDKNLFIVFLCLHDIGKPQAFFDGDKNKQYAYSKRIVCDIWKNLPFTTNELKLILALLDGDFIGEYFQNKLTLKETKIKIFKLANSCNIKVFDFFKIYIVYYQCDIASYTVDAGGIKFLEHLFEYENGEKVFDEEEGLLKMSPKYWDKYKQLKNEIENGN